MFKYMIHRFGYIQASIYFSDFIKNALTQGAYLQKAQANQNHNLMIQHIIERFKKSQTLHQQSMDVLSSVKH